MKHPFIFFLLVSLVLISASCKQNRPKYAREKPSFEKFTNIKYTEIRRAFANGVSFNEQGFQQQPEWIMYFLPKDSIKVYSPHERKFLHYRIYFDHDSVVSMAREWFRIKKITKDSLVMQLLQVASKKISIERSNVYMTFLSESYLKNKLLNPENLKRPNHNDTVFIAAKVQKANRNPSVLDSCFAARIPVRLQAKSAVVKVDKIVSTPDMIDANSSDEYLYPEYNVTLHKAYKNFDYSFYVLVDPHGELRFAYSALAIMDEFVASQTKIMKGITAIYLQNLLQIYPGTTLGMPHTSLVKLNVKGIKN